MGNATWPTHEDFFILCSDNKVEQCGLWNRLSIPVLLQDMFTTACYRALELDVSGIDSGACAKKMWDGPPCGMWDQNKRWAHYFETARREVGSTRCKLFCYQQNSYKHCYSLDQLTVEYWILFYFFFRHKNVAT